MSMSISLYEVKGNGIDQNLGGKNATLDQIKLFHPIIELSILKVVQEVTYNLNFPQSSLVDVD